MNLSDIQIPRIKVSIRIVAVLLVIVGAVYFFWTTNTKVPEIEESTTKLLTENESLAATEKNLTMLYESMDFYLDETQRLHDDTEKLLLEFPTFMYLEDKILYAYALIDGERDTNLGEFEVSKGDLNGYNLMDLNYGPSAFLMNVSYGVGEDAKLMELYSVNLHGRYLDLTYKQIKEFLDYGLNSPQRFVVNQLTMGYNEKTGYISGEFSFKTFFIPGQTTPYEFPQEVVEDLGDSDRVDDLFGARLTPLTETPGYEAGSEEDDPSFESETPVISEDPSTLEELFESMNGEGDETEDEENTSSLSDENE